MDMVGMGPSFFLNEEGMEVLMHVQVTPECYIITLPTKLLGYSNTSMPQVSNEVKDIHRTNLV